MKEKLKLLVMFFLFLVLISESDLPLSYELLVKIFTIAGLVVVYNIEKISFLLREQKIRF